MDPTLIAQGLVSGVLFGGVYSLMAIGLTLIFGVMRIVNFAHGDMMVWGMYLAWLLATRLGIDPTLGFAVCAAALASPVAAASALAAVTVASGPAQYQTMCAIGK